MAPMITGESIDTRAKMDSVTSILHHSSSVSLDRLRSKRDAALRNAQLEVLNARETMVRVRGELDSVGSKCDSQSETDQISIDKEIERTNRELLAAKNKLRALQGKNESLKVANGDSKALCAVAPRSRFDQLDAGDARSISSDARFISHGPAGERTSEAASQEDMVAAAAAAKVARRRRRKVTQYGSWKSWGSRSHASSASSITSDEMSVRSQSSEATIEKFEIASRKDKETIHRLMSELVQVRTSFKEQEYRSKKTIEKLKEENASTAITLSTLMSNKGKLEATMQDQHDRLIEEHRAEVKHLKSKIDSRDATIASYETFLKKLRNDLTNRRSSSTIQQNKESFISVSQFNVPCS